MLKRIITAVSLKINFYNALKFLKFRINIISLTSPFKTIVMKQLSLHFWVRKIMSLTYLNKCAAIEINTIDVFANSALPKTAQ